MRGLAAVRLPPLPRDTETTLLHASDIGSHRRRNVCRWVIARYAERFAAIFDIPGNHHAYSGTPWETCESPALLPNYQFGAMMQDRRSDAATL